MSKFNNELEGSQVAVVQEPSPQRVRNILSLEERVRAIHAYDKCQKYTKVAKMFNCSWEQIKRIVANRGSILEFHGRIRYGNNTDDLECDEIRKRKLTYLGECVYEYIQRVQFHQHTDLNEDLLRTKAFKFRDLIQIDKFVPNKSWINHFKATYNISLSNRQITLTRTPPDSLDLKDIMTYCGKNKSLNDTNQRDRDQPPAAVTLTPKENTEITALREKMRLEASEAKKTKTTSNNFAVVETNYQSYDDDLIVVEGNQDIIIIEDDDTDGNENEDIVAVNNETQDTADCDPPPLKIQKITTFTSPFSNDKPPQSSGHCSEHSGDNDPYAQEPLPNIIRNYKDALRLLKPLEEFAKLEENYRVIGLISELEEIFKNQPEANRIDNSDEDNISK